MREVLYGSIAVSDSATRQYLVVTKSELTRDSQVYIDPLTDDEGMDIFDDTKWFDCAGGVVLGVYTAPNEDEAIKAATVRFPMCKENLEAYLLSDANDIRKDDVPIE